MTCTTSCSSPPKTEALPIAPGRWDRIRQTRTLRDAAHDLWLDALIVVIGLGTIGSRLAQEIVRSGASVLLIDPDTGDEHNLGTQLVDAGGRSKAESVKERCDAIEPGRAHAVVEDVRHVGPGALSCADVVIDSTDDPGLALPLTETCNGLQVPLVRPAVDGTGEHEVGRVLVSHGGAGHACQICSYSPEDLLRGGARTPCPGGEPGGEDGPPTRAGGALAMVVAGMALLHAQRLVGGVGRDQVLDQETLVDLDHGRLLPLELERQRSDRCLADHTPWTLSPLPRSAADVTAAELFAVARDRLDADPARGSSIVLEPYQHPLCLAVHCTTCEVSTTAVGTPWATAPRCETCGGRTRWSLEHRWPRFNRLQAERMGILDTPLADLGLPRDGAQVVARCPGRPPVRLLLAADIPDAVTTLPRHPRRVRLPGAPS